MVQNFNGNSSTASQGNDDDDEWGAEQLSWLFAINKWRKVELKAESLNDELKVYLDEWSSMNRQIE